MSLNIIAIRASPNVKYVFTWFKCQNGTNHEWMESIDIIKTASLEYGNINCRVSTTNDKKENRLFYSNASLISLWKLKRNSYFITPTNNPVTVWSIVSNIGPVFIVVVCLLRHRHDIGGTLRYALYMKYPNIWIYCGPVAIFTRSHLTPSYYTRRLICFKAHRQFEIMDSPSVTTVVLGSLLPGIRFT